MCIKGLQVHEAKASYPEGSVGIVLDVEFHESHLGPEVFECSASVFPGPSLVAINNWDYLENHISVFCHGT